MEMGGWNRRGHLFYGIHTMIEDEEEVSGVMYALLA